MKNLINYNYNLYPEDIIKKDNMYHFVFNGIKYIICPFLRPIEDLEKIEKVNFELEKQGVAFYKIMINRDKKSYFIYNDKNFLLLMETGKENKVCDEIDILNFNRLLKTKDNTILNRNNYGELWSEKIDYYEYSLSLLNKESNDIMDDFNYFIGLGENAISYYSNTLIETKEINDEYYLSHKRMKDNITKNKLFFPPNYIFDYYLRDLCEYYKFNIIYNNTYDLDSIEKIINKYKPNVKEIRMFYARGLFPTFYFDALNKYIENSDKKDLLIIKSKIDIYENYLKDLYNILKKYYILPEVEWLMKNKI